MPEDSDSNFMNDHEHESDEIFTPRPETTFRKRHLRKVSQSAIPPKRSRSGRMERLLRPLKSQSYADPHSSMHSNSSDNENTRQHEQENDGEYLSYAHIH